MWKKGKKKPKTSLFLTSLTEAYVTRLMFTSSIYGQTEKSDTDTNSLEFPRTRETEHNYSRFYLRCGEVSLSRWWRNSLWVSRAESRLRIRAGWAMGSVWRCMCTFHFPLRPSYNPHRSLIVNPSSSSLMLSKRRKRKFKVDAGWLQLRQWRRSRCGFKRQRPSTSPVSRQLKINRGIGALSCLNANEVWFCLLNAGRMLINIHVT